MAGSPKNSGKKTSSNAGSPKNSQAGSPKNSKKEEEEHVIRVSRNHTPSFYIRAANQFMHGVVGKDGVEKQSFPTIVVSALGAAIPIAALVGGTLEKDGSAKIVKVNTSYAELEFGKRAQVLITLRRVEGYKPPQKPSAAASKASSRSNSPSRKKVSTGSKQSVKSKFSEGPPCPEKLNSDKLSKKMAKVRKEGGKRGVEIEGQADMGGLKYFCTKVLEPAGDLDMLIESVKAMNQKCEPTEEERKGGSGAVGKTIMSMAEQNDLCICAYTPATDQDLDATQWLKATLDKCGLPKDYPLRSDSNAVYAQVHIKNDEEKNVFCLKIRDYVIQHANGFLVERGLVPEPEDDEDDMIFGDDDFDM